MLIVIWYYEFVLFLFFILCNLIFIFQGFCVSVEFEDEVAGEGVIDFEDIEGGGFGEGEGVKDVSDQIENEDQVG